MYVCIYIAVINNNRATIVIFDVTVIAPDIIIIINMSIIIRTTPLERRANPPVSI